MARMSDSRIFHLLLVDDDPLIHQALRVNLPTHWKLTSARQISEVPWGKFFNAAFVDMHLTESKDPVGLEVIRKLYEKMPNLEVIAISGDISRELMEACLKLGAQRFLSKPLIIEEVLLLVEKIEAFWTLRNFETHHQNSQVLWVGDSSASQNMVRALAQLRGETRNILLEGETGTGKEVAARLLNQQEGKRPFVAVNMASLPENIFESEMFGHVKGAFTGADQNKIGLCEAAHGGDLFLDEIEALLLPLQAKLLRFLESGEIRRLGARESVYVQTRVIAASNKSLEKMVKDGSFREDLFFRLGGHKIQLPRLRQRLDDIPALVKYFLKAERPRRSKTFAEDGLKALQEYTWPGNVRELRRVCEQLSLTSPLPVIRQEDVKGLLNPSTSRPEGKTWDFSAGLSRATEEFEAYIITECLRQNRDIEKAAELLKISRSSLYKKIKDYNIDEALNV